MALCAILLAAGSLAGCGGGNGGAAATAAAVSDVVAAAPAPSATPPDVTSGSPPVATAPVEVAPVDNPVSSLSLADQFAAALISYAEVSPALVTLSDTVSEAAPVAGTSATALSAAGNSVTALASTGSTRSTYVTVTDEWHTFTILGTAVVRYGVPSTNTWITKTVTNYVECTTDFFGSDPGVGKVKECQAPSANVPLSTMATNLSATTVLSRAAGLMPLIDLTKIPMPYVGSGALRIAATTEVPPYIDGGGSFRTNCGTVKMSFDDPIVYPGQPGKSHLHTFFGNTGVNASSTSASLTTTGTSTCRGGIANRSAYWVPSMIDTRTGAPVLPDSNNIYYKGGVLPASAIHPIPAGLRMIAGDAAGSTPGSSAAEFKCIGGPNNENDKYGSEIPNCDVGAQIWQVISFPQCWDGVNFDSPDHKSHMAYPRNSSTGFACPATHPVGIPNISFNVMYTVHAPNEPTHWRLSSDNYDRSKPGGYSSHGDWFNGWKPDISDAWANHCLKASVDCHSHLVGDGRMMY